MRVSTKIAGAVAAAGIAAVGVTGCTPEQIQAVQAAQAQRSPVSETAINSAYPCSATPYAWGGSSPAPASTAPVWCGGRTARRASTARRLLQPDQLRLRRRSAAAR